jgi:Methyltransferase domain
MHPSDFQRPIREYFRRRRFLTFRRDYGSCQTILDIGGDHLIWRSIGRSNGITVLNLSVPPRAVGFPYVQGSGCELPFGDKSFDLAFSNSAIEHVGSEEKQLRFAREMMRVGKRVYCQTPSRAFPVDPHITMPFLHWLPNSWLKPRVLRYCTLSGWLLGKAYRYDVTWVSKRKLKQLFPGCAIRTERFLFMAKSFIATDCT